MSETSVGDLLPLRDIAHMFGVSHIRAWQWIAEGRLPAYRLGNYWYVMAADAADFRPRRAGRPRKEQSCA